MGTNKRYYNMNLTIFTAVMVFLYIPILIMVIFSFNDSRVVSTWQGFTLRYYGELFANRDITMAFRNTLLVAVTSTIISTILGVVAALALENRRFTGQKMMRGLIYLPLIMPDILMGVSLALLYNFLKVPTGMLTVVIAHITFCLSYTVIVVQSRLQGFDYSLEEAAMDLGANKWQIFFKIKLPLLMPGIVAAALLAFTLSLDDFVITFFTSGRGFDTLPIYVEGAIRRGSMTTINALSTLMIGLTLLLVVVSKKFRNMMVQGHVN